MNMKKDQLQKKNPEGLASLLDKTRKELVELRFKVAINKIQNHTEIRKKKKDVARILTMING